MHDTASIFKLNTHKIENKKVKIPCSFKILTFIQGENPTEHKNPLKLRVWNRGIEKHIRT